MPRNSSCVGFEIIFTAAGFETDFRAGVLSRLALMASSSEFISLLDCIWKRMLANIIMILMLTSIAMLLFNSPDNIASPYSEKASDNFLVPSQLDVTNCDFKLSNSSGNLFIFLIIAASFFFIHYLFAIV